MISRKQAEVFDFLGQAEAYEPRPEAIHRIETHASMVFLAGSFAYKVKRAVKYPFLDFSTLEKRHQACLNELRVNARTAPQLYLEVLPITAGTSGEFQIGGKGQAREGEGHDVAVQLLHQLAMPAAAWQAAQLGPVPPTPSRLVPWQVLQLARPCEVTV